jgi:transcriptional regulator with XRE-family HTH domain
MRTKAPKRPEPTPQQVALGARLRAARIAAGFPRITGFARELAVEQPTVYRIEKGQTYPSVQTLERWADVCECSVDDLLGRTTEAA